MNITDYKKKYLKYKAKYLNIKGGAPQMDIGKAKAAVRNINFLITAFLPKDIDGEFDMTESKKNYAVIVTSHTFDYCMREYLLYELTTTGDGNNDSDANKQNYNTLVNGLTRFGVKGLKNYKACMDKECTDRFKRYGKLSPYPHSAKNYMNKLMYINAIYILSILKYDYIYNLYKWLIENCKEKIIIEGIEIKIEDYCIVILNSIFALKLAIYYLIINGKNGNDTYENSMFSTLGINENELIRLMNKDAIGDTKCNNLFNINGIIVNNYKDQIKKIKIKLLKHIKFEPNCKKKWV